MDGIWWALDDGSLQSLVDRGKQWLIGRRERDVSYVGDTRMRQALGEVEGVTKCRLVSLVPGLCLTLIPRRRSRRCVCQYN